LLEDGGSRPEVNSKSAAEMRDAVAAVIQAVVYFSGLFVDVALIAAYCVSIFACVTGLWDRSRIARALERARKSLVAIALVVLGWNTFALLAMVPISLLRPHSFAPLFREGVLIAVLRYIGALIVMLFIPGAAWLILHLVERRRQRSSHATDSTREQNGL
jgi:hypothetical protein